MKRLFSLPALAATLILAAGCNKTETERQRMVASHIDASLAFLVADPSGNNQIVPDVFPTYDGYPGVDVIRYNGKKAQVFSDPLMGAPKGYSLYSSPQGGAYIDLYLERPYVGESTADTYIRFWHHPIDKLTAEYEYHESEIPGMYGGSSLVVVKVWLNGELFWDREAAEAGPDGALPVMVRPQPFYMGQ